MERECTKCHRGELTRTARQGVLEKYICALFGMYPWRCRRCRHRKLLRDRGDTYYGLRHNKESTSVKP